MFVHVRVPTAQLRRFLSVQNWNLALRACQQRLGMPPLINIGGTDLAGVCWGHDAHVHDERPWPGSEGAAERSWEALVAESRMAHGVFSPPLCPEVMSTGTEVSCRACPAFQGHRRATASLVFQLMRHHTCLQLGLPTAATAAQTAAPTAANHPQPPSSLAATAAGAAAGGDAAAADVDASTHASAPAQPIAPLSPDSLRRLGGGAGSLRGSGQCACDMWPGWGWEAASLSSHKGQVRAPRCAGLCRVMCRDLPCCGVL